MDHGNGTAEDPDEKDMPLEEDLKDDEASETVPCPSCGESIHEDTVKCPHCGQWIIDRPRNEILHSKWFWPIVIAIGVVMILVTLVGKALR